VAGGTVGAGIPGTGEGLRVWAVYDSLVQEASERKVKEVEDKVMPAFKQQILGQGRQLQAK
jgi:hypothetical protein